MLRNDKVNWRRTASLLAAILLTTSGAIAQQGPTPRDMVLEGGTLIDGTGRAPIANAVILVEGSRIKAVGRRGQVSIPANANVINLAGRTILPGLINSHAHLQDYEMPMFLPYGVTTVADLNNDTAWILSQREALRTGLIKGPRLLVSGTFIWGPLAPRDGGTFNTPIARTVEDARQIARDRIAAGVDIVKVDNGITDQQLAAVIEEANRAGLPAMGHTQNILSAAKLGFKHAEHSYTLANALLDPDEKIPPRLYPSFTGPVAPPQIAPETQMDPKQFPPLIDYLVRQGVFLNPTLVSGWLAATSREKDWDEAVAQALKDPGLAFLPPQARANWARPDGKAREGYANVAAFLKEYAASGGKIVVGSEPGLGRSFPGLSVHFEMQILNDIGLTPMQAIEGATLWNAQMLKKDKDLGSVEPGKLADLLVIEGDPLANISATRNVRMVIKEGQVMDTKYDPNWVNPIPQPFSTTFGAPPQITTFSPRTAPQNGQAVTLTIEGNKFTPKAVVRFDDTDLPTHFVSNTELTATLDGRFLQRPMGAYVLYVVNTGLHGTISTPAYFLVDVKK